MKYVRRLTDWSISRYWLTSEEDPDKDQKIQAVCHLYEKAAELTTAGERVVSTDEMTGVQALQRKHPGLPMVPTKVERRVAAEVFRCLVQSGRKRVEHSG